MRIAGNEAIGGDGGNKNYFHTLIVYPVGAAVYYSKQVNRKAIMSHVEENQDQVAASKVAVEADGYYGEEDLEDGELDLSFLDEDDQDEAAGHDKPVENK